ncbi:hypothetical protein [Falsirhodobacter halotolerans]|uniref:hypothetical protein n=1 Tax=Falsirhodobacter halotolerans TaxID=1146892 RepID=UPI001FD11552|nr:hypothetical protein [Falsirhodobacter halotolerans]MCJ8139530.1 hypothetical protein [Falsirhodobacter halotolerans]
MNLDLIIERFGLVGLVLIGMAGALLILWRRLTEVQDARIADQERNAERLAKLSTESTTAMRDVGGDLTTLAQVIKDRRNG